MDSGRCMLSERDNSCELASGCIVEPFKVNPIVIRRAKRQALKDLLLSPPLHEKNKEAAAQREYI
jgi:hypothetical protein